MKRIGNLLSRLGLSGAGLLIGVVALLTDFLWPQRQWLEFEEL